MSRHHHPPINPNIIQQDASAGKSGNHSIYLGDKIKGEVNQAAGKVRQGVNELTDNVTMKAKGEKQEGAATQ